MSKTTNDRHFGWWGAPDRHILVPHPPKLGYGSSKEYQMKLLEKCLVHVYLLRNV